MWSEKKGRKRERDDCIKGTKRVLRHHACDIKRQTSRQASSVKRQASNVWHQTSNARHQNASVKRSRRCADIRGWARGYPKGCALIRPQFVSLVLPLQTTQRITKPGSMGISLKIFDQNQSIQAPFKKDGKTLCAEKQLNQWIRWSEDGTDGMISLDDVEMNISNIGTHVELNKKNGWVKLTTCTFDRVTDEIKISEWSMGWCPLQLILFLFPFIRPCSISHQRRRT